MLIIVTLIGLCIDFSLSCKHNAHWCTLRSLPVSCSAIIFPSAYQSVNGGWSRWPLLSNGDLCRLRLNPAAFTIVLLFIPRVPTPEGKQASLARFMCVHAKHASKSLSKYLWPFPGQMWARLQTWDLTRANDWPVNPREAKVSILDQTKINDCATFIIGLSKYDRGSGRSRGCDNTPKNFVHLSGLIEQKENHHPSTKPQKLISTLITC